MMSIMEQWKHAYVESYGLQIHYVTAGEGPLVILLHGFPQFWYAWRHQIPALAKRFKVVAPDLRGYGNTDKLPDIDDYAMHNLSKDILGLMECLGYKKAHIVGHDWGGAVAWDIAINHPEALDKLVIINSPHPQIIARALKTNFRQIGKSWYMFVFQIPHLPEFLFKQFSSQFIKGILRGKAIRKEAFTDEDLDRYLFEIEKPYAFPSALNYYRAAFKSRGKKRENKKITAPTLIIWGEGDTALGKELTYNMDPLFKAPFRIHYIPNCSHWVQEEQPEAVNKLLLDFLQ